MILVIFILIVIGLMWLAYNKEVFYGIDDVIFAGFFSSLVLASIFDFMCLTTNKVEIDRQDVTYEIYSLKLNDNTSGSFVLGSGYISTDPEYICYYKDDAGFYKLGRYSTNYTRLMECDKSDGFHPHARYQIVTSRLPYWLSPIGSAEWQTSTDLYVPKGTIIEEYKGN